MIKRQVVKKLSFGYIDINPVANGTVSVQLS